MAERGYGKRSFIDLLAGFGFRYAFIIPDHLLRVHLFDASSYLNPRIIDLEEESLLLH